MNNKVSIILRALAIVLSAGAIALFFLIKGEMDNAVAKARPLAQVAKTSEEPYDYKKLSKPVDLKTAMEIVSPACNEIQKRREQKLKDDATIEAQKNTIAQREQTIEGLKSEIDAKVAENAELTRAREELEGKVAQLERDVATKERDRKMWEDRANSYTERMATMKTDAEYKELLAKIDDLKQEKEAGMNRYRKLWNLARRGGADLAEYPSDLYGKLATEAKYESVTPSIPVTLQRIDEHRGLLMLVAEKGIELNQSGVIYNIKIKEEDVEKLPKEVKDEYKKDGGIVGQVDFPNIKSDSVSVIGYIRSNARTLSRAVSNLEGTDWQRQLYLVPEKPKSNNGN